MKIASIKFNPWDKAYSFRAGELDLARGDKVLVKTEMGLDLGEVVEIVVMDDSVAVGQDMKDVIRLANSQDMEKIPSQEERKKTLEHCKQLVGKLELPMKLVDAHFSYDGSRITFAFISNGRVDFRELVKELTKHYNRTIRLHQIGIRDEAKLFGDCGHCGRPLCCSGFLKELTSVTSDMAELQQVAHRGSERISGVCGRLMCCLGHEQKNYEEISSKLPPLDSTVSYQGKKGRVVGWHVIRESVDVEFAGENGEKGTVIEIEKKDLK